MENDKQKKINLEYIEQLSQLIYNMAVPTVIEKKDILQLLHIMFLNYKIQGYLDGIRNYPAKVFEYSDEKTLQEYQIGGIYIECQKTIGYIETYKRYCYDYGYQFGQKELLKNNIINTIHNNNIAKLSL